MMKEEKETGCPCSFNPHWI